MSWLPSFLVVLAGYMLVTAFLMLGRMRLRSLLTLFVGQSMLLALYAAVASRIVGEPHLLITAALVFIVKGFFIPLVLMRSAERGKAETRLYSYLKPSASFFCSACVILFAFAFTMSLPLGKLHLPHGQWIIGISLSIVLLGMLMLIVRKSMYDQMVGFLMMENGIFIFGLALTGGMPLLVEVGIFADIMIGSVLMAALSYRVQRMHHSVRTDHLSELVD